MARIALVSTNGTDINEHFGRAKFFRIYDLSENSYEFAEVRDIIAATQKPRQHSETDFDRVISLISDCDALLVEKIGEGAAAYLLGKGVRIFEVSGSIEGVLNKIISDKLFINETNQGA